MPSARSPRAGLAGVVLALAGAGLLAGCSSTQQTAARLRLNSARLVQAGNGTRVTHGAGSAAVRRVSLVRSTGRAAAIVTVTNTGDHALSDLPISVGYTQAGRTTYLNAGTNLGYFNAHLPLISPGQTINWVFSTGHRVPPGARPFARVGAKPAVAVGKVTSVPDLSVSAGAVSHGTVALRIHNTTGLPQYQLQIYYVGRRGARVVSAGVKTVSYIGSGSISTVKIRPAGAGAGAAVQIEALPTIFK